MKITWRQIKSLWFAIAAASLAALWTKLQMPMEPWAALTFVLGLPLFYWIAFELRFEK